MSPPAEMVGFTLSDLGLAAVVGVVAVVPAAMVFLLLAAGLRILRAEERLGTPAFRAVTGMLTALVAVGCALLAWSWAGATHLRPRCAARAQPVYSALITGDAEEGSTPALLPVAAVLVEAPGVADRPPGWAMALLGPQGFPHIEWRRADGSLVRMDRGGRITPIETPMADALLQVSRSSARSSYWTRISVDRFTLRETATRRVLAEGEEMWVDAGPARYRCGIVSGPLPVRANDYPPGAGVLGFLAGAVVPTG